MPALVAQADDRRVRRLAPGLLGDPRDVQRTGDDRVTQIVDDLRDRVKTSLELIGDQDAQVNLVVMVSARCGRL